MLALLAQAEEPITSVTNSIQFDAFLVTGLVSLIIPFFTALITKASASPTVKQVVTIVLAAVNTLIVSNTLQDGTAVISKENGLLWAVSTAIAITSYLGIYKPHALDAKTNPEFGLG